METNTIEPADAAARRQTSARLTALRVKTVKKPGRYGDGNGLCLIVDESGSKRWMLRVVARGKRCDLGLGSTTLVSLVDARDEAVRSPRRWSEVPPLPSAQWTIANNMENVLVSET